MSETAKMPPFFTERDNKILSGESVRDPLGLLPIWSAVGHDLIPGLASIVSRIDGIQGVMFIYAGLNELPLLTERKVSDDRVLRFLERLWEYHLYQYRDKRPCFGINSLSTQDFQLSTTRAGVVGTGLRQYYRGTCVNKGIMAGNIKSLNEPYTGLAKALLSKELLQWLRQSVANMERGSGYYSLSASGEYEKLRNSLESFSLGSMALWKALEKSLIANATQQAWIQHVVTQTGWREFTIPALAACIQDYADQRNNELLHNQCQRILDCEPFIQLLEGVFQMAQEARRCTITSFSQRLARTAPVDLPEICKNFQRIHFKSNRLENLKKLAACLCNEEFSTFVMEFLQGYYASVCKERGKNPMLYIDGGDIIALKPEKSENHWGKPRSVAHWSGYFIKPQISLYVDLMQRIEDSR